MGQEKAVNVWPTGLKELGSGVYAYQQPGGWGRTNAGLIVGEDYAIVVDTQYTEELTLNFINEIRGVTDKPVRYIVHTHHHGDHVHGDHLFADAQVVCHDNCCRTLLSRKAPDLDRLVYLYPNLDFSGVTYPKPEITFSQSMSIYQGNRRIDLICGVK